MIDGTIVVKGDSISETVSLESIKDVKVYEDMILIYKWICSSYNSKEIFG